MTSIDAIDNDVFQLTTTHAVQSVFNTMLGLTPDPVPVIDDRGAYPHDRADLHVIGTAGLVGSINGVIYLLSLIHI